LTKKWRTSILISGLITFIAAVHYLYMRDYWAAHTDSPTFFRYVDWVLTVPLMCVEFYLILKVAGAKKSLMWRLIFLSVIMLVTGYIGEAVDQSNAWLWGLLSGAAYFVIAYDIWLGSAKKISSRSWWSCFTSSQSALLVCISWMGYLSIRVHGRYSRMVFRNVWWFRHGCYL